MWIVLNVECEHKTKQTAIWSSNELVKAPINKKKEEEHERCARMAWGTFAAGIIAELFAIQLFWRVNVKSFRFSF